MSVINPPGWLQNAGATHTAEQMRNWHSLLMAGPRSAAALMPRGGVNPGLGNALRVTQTGSPSMAVIVKSGLAAVPGTLNARQGIYSCLNDGDVTLSIAAAHATLNRIDIVVLRVQDSGYAGALNTSTLEVVTGTPASSPAAPSAPDNSLILASVLIVANDTAITDSEITDLRPFLGAAGGTISVKDQAERDALIPYKSLAVYRRDTDNVEYYNGSSWVGATGTWTPWVPTFFQLTVGAGTTEARWRKRDNTADFDLVVTLGAGFSVGVLPEFTIPFTPRAANHPDLSFIANASLHDTGTATYYATARWASGTSRVTWVLIGANGIHGVINSTTPHAWAAGDILTCYGRGIELA